MLSNLRATTCREYAKFRRKPVMKGERLFPGAKDATIRRELTTLSAAIRHWHREHGPLSSIPAVTMPDKPAPKADWLDRQASAQLLAGALGFYRCQWSDVTTRKVQSAWRRDRQAICRHAARFILVGLYTGTRHAAVLGVRWLPSIDGGWIDLDRGVMHRRGRASVRRPSGSHLSGLADASLPTCAAGSFSMMPRALRRRRSTIVAISKNAITCRRHRSSMWSPTRVGRSRSCVSLGMLPVNSLRSSARSHRISFATLARPG